MRISDWSSDVCSSDLREDQLGIGAEKFGVAMVVTIAGAVPLFARVVAPGPVVVAGMVIGGDPLANPHLQLARSSAHFPFCGFSPIIFDPDQPAMSVASLYYPGQRPYRLAPPPPPPFGTDPLHLH